MDRAESAVTDQSVESPAANLPVRLMQYHTPTLARGIVELALSAIPFVLTWYAMYWATTHGQGWLYWLLLPVSVGFVVRLFLIQHDCGHLAFFPSRRANDWLGRCIGVITVTPYMHWRLAHAIHHATSGNLGRRGVGDIDTLTVAEFRARTFWTRLRYRVYRNPLMMFGIGPAFVFLLQNRLPAGFFRGWRNWASTIGTDVSIAAVVVLMSYWIGFGAFVRVHLPIMLLSATVGGWLFYVQHQFENTYWRKPEQWNLRDAALNGSSHYDLPVVLRWFTANIGMHHVHHLCSRIPFYRLPRAMREHAELRQTGRRVTLWQSFRCARLTLWDEETGRLVTFREALHPA